MAVSDIKVCVITLCLEVCVRLHGVVVRELFSRSENRGSNPVLTKIEWGHERLLGQAGEDRMGSVPLEPGTRSAPPGVVAGLRCSCHRSHFGSRYKLGCCGHAGLFALASFPVFERRRRGLAAAWCLLGLLCWSSVPPLGFCVVLVGPLSGISPLDARLSHMLS